MTDQHEREAPRTTLGCEHEQKSKPKRVSKDEARAAVLRERPNARVERWYASEHEQGGPGAKFEIIDGDEHLSIYATGQPSRPEAWRRALAYINNPTLAKTVAQGFLDAGDTNRDFWRRKLLSMSATQRAH